MQKLSYSEGEVSVCLVRGKEAPKSMLEASDSGLEVDRRTSKRSRRTNYGKQTSLKVSATTTVYQLKMMIWQLLGVMSSNIAFVDPLVLIKFQKITWGTQ